MLSKCIEQYDELFKVVSTHVEDPLMVKLWFQISNPLLNNESPMDWIESGRYDKLVEVMKKDGVKFNE